MTNLETLEHERQLLIEQVRGLREAVRVEVDTDPDEGDPDLTEREKNLMLIAALEKELLSTEKAIRALQKGTYGICERCAQPIPAERLEVRPEATHCVKCQAEVERLIRRGLMRAAMTRRPLDDDDDDSEL